MKPALCLLLLTACGPRCRVGLLCLLLTGCSVSASVLIHGPTCHVTMDPSTGAVDSASYFGQSGSCTVAARGDTVVVVYRRATP